MAFRDNAYATVWETRQTKGESVLVRISTSYKDKKSDQYVNDFSDYVFFTRDAAKKAANLKPKDRIKLLQTSATSQYDKEKKTSRYTFTVWDFEPVAATGGSEKQQGSVVPPKAPVIAEGDELPF